eukprot:TRINITY_DN36767_c0_g1_i4.p1 TRINITY_DN36767_c0_g1~~TRINITY_DN36767_c0_g1_i4.p1  ORF type:complete len:407 (-),score=78.59 TRINITY_DN36767_c0_g1_i4:398-1618(-)
MSANELSDSEFEEGCKNDFWRKDAATVFIFKCKDCDKQFLDIAHLWDHMEFSHEEEDAKLMMSCRNTEVHKYTLINSREFSNVVCTYCDMIFLGADQLNDHKVSEHKDHLLSCDNCEFQTFEKKTLKFHEKVIHNRKCREEKGKKATKRKPWLCTECKFQAGTEKELLRHKEALHPTGPMQYMCQYCHFKASKLSYIRDHQESEHKVKYKCEFCNFEAKKNGPLKAHKKTAHNIVENENVTCAQCGLVAKSASSLYRHIKRDHEGRVFPCQQCDLKFTASFTLKNHIAIKHGTKDLLCDKCDFRAATNLRMKLHNQAKHSGVSFQCPYCSHQSPFSGDLSKHIKFVHEGIRFPCSLCSFVSTRRIEVKRHLKKVHDLTDEAIDTMKIKEEKMDQFVKKKAEINMVP